MKVTQLRRPGTRFSQEEIEDALHYAKSSVGWSTYVSGLQLDYEKFKKEIKQACLYASKKKK